MSNHIPEYDLAVYALSPDAVSREFGDEIRRHTASCGHCQTSLEFFIISGSDLANVDSWEPSVGSATMESLFAFGAQIAQEDREANALLAPLLAAPAKTAWTSIATQRRYLHGGVARRLTREAHDVCASEPLHALTFAEAAIEVAERLPDDAYPSKAVFEVRGTAWKERANALIRLGDATDALQALSRAECSYRELASPGLGLANVALVRAAAFYQQERLTDAIAQARLAENGYAHIGDDERRMKAVFLCGEILYEAKDLDAALVIFREVIAYGESSDRAEWIAKGSYCVGSCLLERGAIAEASMLFQTALAILRETGPVADRLSTEWGIARVLLHTGKYPEAIRHLRGVSAEFARRGMTTDAGLALLDSADALVALGDHRKVVDVATRAFRIFSDAGMLTSALTALAYLRDVAAAGTITREDVLAVRTFVRRAEREPDLLFAPPPKYR